MKQALKLGTRRSLLAWAQSGWVAREIERLNPGVSVERVGIETRGDQIQDVPLQAVQGKEFFVAELDHALITGQVDLSVHSMKDLSLERPSQVALAAVPRRENPRDVILFGPEVLEAIERGRRLRIGTSSPRRQVNIPPFLEGSLPIRGGRSAQVELVELRGNVNTRLSRVLESVGSARRLDAVVLAFAGLIRLWADPAGKEELTRLLKGIRWMVLPLAECPSAPAQGALAVECRAEDGKVREVLAPLHDPMSARQVAMERQILADWGGGCHQKFGATAVPCDDQLLLRIRGIKPGGEAVNELRWQPPAFPGLPGLKAAQSQAWDGSRWRAETESLDMPLDTSNVRILPGQGVFVAHGRAARPELAPALSMARVWTAGAKSWSRLAKMGIWVEGCAEGLGFDDIQPMLKEPVLELSGWKILTHDAAHNQNVEPTYRASVEYPEGARASLREANWIFWSSGSQFTALGKEASRQAAHACGPGSTARKLRAAGLTPLIFPSVEEWRKWIQSNQKSSRSGG